MTLKTYRARTLADALARIKKDLGRDAVILHTRSFKVGGVLGFGAKPMVEITATASVNVAPRKAQSPRPQQQAAPAQDDPPIVLRPEALRAVDPALAATRLRQAYGSRSGSTSAGDGGVAVAEPPEPARRESFVAAVAEAPSAVSPASVVALETELASIKAMVTQVLTRSAGASPNLPESLQTRYLQLLEAEVASDIASEVVEQVLEDLSRADLADDEAVHAAVLRRLSAYVDVADDEEAPPRRAGKGEPARIALVGPTGVGKTTTIAKLAATYKLRHGLKVGLITADTYRIAAVDQLRTYANIIGLPLQVVSSPADMEAACAALADRDVILLDTAGRSPSDQLRLDELRALLAAARPTQTHLVLSSTSSEKALLQTAERFSSVNPDRVIFTKLDEAVNFGVLLNVARRIDTKLSFLTTGQEVPDQIERSRPDRLARLVLAQEAVR